jgi:predicted RecA/RadA family phage recombinase
VVPYLVLISDLDRATKNQAEALRLILDSITGRVQGPDGRVHKVLDGTKIVATANSSGSGDTSGRCISSNPIDASILDRFEVKIRFNAMDWRDEVEILKQEFPQLTQESLMVVGNVVAAVRAAAKQGLQFDLSHRGVVGWCKMTTILIKTGMIESQALKVATRSFIDGAGDEYTEQALKVAIDPHIAGGLLQGGSSTSGRLTEERY